MTTENDESGKHRWKSAFSHGRADWVPSLQQKFEEDHLSQLMLNVKGEYTDNIETCPNFSSSHLNYLCSNFTYQTHAATIKKIECEQFTHRCDKEALEERHVALKPTKSHKKRTSDPKREKVYFSNSPPHSSFSNNCDSRTSLHIPRLVPQGTCYLTPPQVMGNPILKVRTSGRNLVLFLSLH